mgnify:CR=1 FL=1
MIKQYLFMAYREDGTLLVNEVNGETLFAEFSEAWNALCAFLMAELGLDPPEAEPKPRPYRYERNGDYFEIWEVRTPVNL